MNKVQETILKETLNKYDDLLKYVAGINPKHFPARQFLNLLNNRHEVEDQLTKNFNLNK